VSARNTSTPAVTCAWKTSAGVVAWPRPARMIPAMEADETKHQQHHQRSANLIEEYRGAIAEGGPTGGGARRPGA
jgi:hypothetical protein